ncbi:MAG: hypothetical protein R3E32_27435 [Chitinophagales bacterium]
MTNSTKQQYFEAVKKLPYQNNHVYSSEELEQIAANLGMSKEAWNGLQKELQDSVMRGKGFMKYENWDDAIEELKHAEQINPFHLGVLMELSESYHQLWLKNSSPIDEELAEQYAKRCLQIQPNHERSLQLISSLKKPAAAMAGAQTNNPNWWKKWLALVVVLLFVGNMLVYNLSQKEESTSKTPTTAPTEKTIENDAIDYGNLQVDIRYDNKNKGLKWMIDDSYLQNFENSFGYNLKMNVLPQGIELTRLRIRVALFDEKRQEIYSQEKQVVSNEAYLHDDFIPVVMTLYNEVTPVPKITSAEVSVVDMKMEILSNMRPPSTKKPFAWGLNKPENMDVEIRERQSKLSASINKKSSYHKIILEVTNRGKYPIKQLKIGVSWVNFEPRMVQAEEVLLVSPSSTTTLKPGQRFILDRTFEVKGYTPEMLKSFGISVTELEY